MHPRRRTLPLLLLLQQQWCSHSISGK